MASDDEDMREEPLLVAGGTQACAAIMETGREIPQRTLSQHTTEIRAHPC